MRLPADATLVVLHGSAFPGDDRSLAEANVAALLAAWRAEALPVVHLRAVVRPETTPSAPFRSPAAPVSGEAVIAGSGAALAPGGALAEALDAIGATALVLCGDSDEILGAVGGAASLGCHAFVVADACWTGAAPGAVEAAPQTADEDAEVVDAKIVDCHAAIAAASVAKVRQRREGSRGR